LREISCHGTAAHLFVGNFSPFVVSGKNLKNILGNIQPDKVCFFHGPAPYFGAPARDDAGFGEFIETPPILSAIRSRVYVIRKAALPRPSKRLFSAPSMPGWNPG
jgi:hypothetical protein